MITVVYCTKESKPQHREHIIKTSGIDKTIEVIEIINNGEGLTRPYNRGLQQAKYDIIVYMHNDVIIETDNWGKKILKHFEENPEYGILGLAGTTDIPESGKWWEDRSKMVGIVNHKHEGKKWESKYSMSRGSELNDVVIVDGLFFAIHKDRIKNTFNENFTGFHFYEVDFVFSNYLKGVKVGVMFDVRVTHLSIGMTNEEWEKSRLQFAEIYKENLPQKLVPEFQIPEPQKTTNLKIPIRIIIQSSGDMKLFKAMYEKIVSFQYPNFKINLIAETPMLGEVKLLNLDNIEFFESYYDILSKNLSIVKLEDNFLDKNDELVFFINEKSIILNNIFANFTKIYRQDKNSFGCGFPLTYNENKTIFCSKLELFSNDENKIAINMKDSNTYYNVGYGQMENPIGGLSDCFVTTKNNLEVLNWFSINFDTPLYFNEFSLRLYLRGKISYIDTNSLVVQNSFVGQTNIQQDFQTLLNTISADKKLQNLVKKIK